MISKKTVLVLGAGASQPYGYPSSFDLKKAILLKATNPEIRNQLNQILGYSDFLINNFVNALESSGFKYVEDFLNERVEFSEIGKILLALVIKEKENIKSLFNNEEWYSYLYNIMNSSFDDFDGNKLSVITFNFDRSIEAYLFNALKSSYNKTEQEILNKLNNIPVIHINGKIGGTKWNVESYGIPFEKAPSKQGLVENAIEIKDIGSDDKKIVQSLLEDAENIIFLGFGYDERNMNKLKISSSSRKVVTGSTLGLGRGEIKSLTEKNKNGLFFGKTKIIQNMNIKDFLKEFALPYFG